MIVPQKDTLSPKKGALFLLISLNYLRLITLSVSLTGYSKLVRGTFLSWVGDKIKSENAIFWKWRYKVLI